jgi:L-ascorbate metabolism protein UlaG (beta-lactamase superfamily)
MVPYERSFGKYRGRHDEEADGMEIRWLGWAGVELAHDGMTLVIDPLADPGATFAAMGDAARDVELPEVTPASGGRAVAALVSHLHRDHTDAGALAAALVPGAAVHHPVPTESRNLPLAQAEHELGEAGLPRRPVATWGSVVAGPFTCTALPAVDGLGDPQVSWVVEAGDRRVLHLGDTVFHGAWWQMARRAGPFDVVFAPINGAVVSFPHQQPPSPLPSVMEPEQAALAGELLGAATVVPMHYGGYALDPYYRPIADARERFEQAARGRSYRVAVPAPGETV